MACLPWYVHVMHGGEGAEVRERGGVMNGARGAASYTPNAAG
jgi:hypothetical protein